MVEPDSSYTIYVVMLTFSLVPGTPAVQAIPYYSHSNQELIVIHTTFNKTVCHSFKLTSVEIFLLGGVYDNG